MQKMQRGCSSNYNMNWGEAGSGDGWYLDALVDAPVQYSNNRWDLIVSPLK